MVPLRMAEMTSQPFEASFIGPDSGFQFLPSVLNMGGACPVLSYPTAQVACWMPIFCTGKCPLK